MAPMGLGLVAATAALTFLHGINGQYAPSTYNAATCSTMNSASGWYGPLLPVASGGGNCPTVAGQTLGAYAAGGTIATANLTAGWNVCCTSIQKAVSQVNGLYPNCYCDSEVFGLVFGAFGPGNALLGSGALGPVWWSTVMSICNAQNFTDLYWPQTYLIPNPPLTAAFPPNPAQSCPIQVAPTPMPSTVRAPYLVNPTSTGITIRWRTAAPAQSVVSYGTSASALTTVLTGDAAASVIEHTVTITGLAPGTKYFYSAGAVSAASGPAGQYFKTAPAVGAFSASRMWFLGDFGEVSSGAATASVTDKGREINLYNAWLGYEAQTGVSADLFLALGDNAYYTGSDQMYQYNFFNVYGNTSGGGVPLLSRTATLPILGNHDTYAWLYTPSTSTGYSYFNTGSMAAGLAAGPGVPSGTPRYYSMNYGRVHIVALDSMCSRSNNSNTWCFTNAPTPTAYPSAVLPASVQGLFAKLGSPAQAQWLAADLASVAASGQIDFIVGMYHHPAYSQGSHIGDKEIEMLEMRTLYNPILEAGGVDIVMHGHSHVYERTIPVAGFTGMMTAWTNASIPGNATVAVALSTTVLPANAPAGILGGTYQLQTKAAGITALSGTTYITSGSGGQLTTTGPCSTGAPLPHAVTTVACGQLVSCGLDFSANAALPSMTLTCVNSTGAIVDTFQVMKAARPPPPPSPPIMASGVAAPYSSSSLVTFAAASATTAVMLLAILL